MDFRKTYAGPSSRPANDPFAQLSKDTRQERDDRVRQESNGGSRVNRPTQSSIAKGTGDNRPYKNSLSARPSGRYNPLSQSVDLGPALRSAGGGSHTPKSNIPRQPGLQGTPQQGTPQQGTPQQGTPQPAASPPPASAGMVTPAAQPKLQDLLDAGQQREALLLEQKRHLEASLHTTNLRCAELARGLQQASAALDAERAATARLRTECDEHAAELDRARSQAAELQVSGSVALTTSEVCRAALSTAFKGTVSAIGVAHEELEYVLEAQKVQAVELEVCRARMAELEEVADEQAGELAAAAAERRQLSEEMEELAGRLQAREDELSHLVSLLVPIGAGVGVSDAAYHAAVAQAKSLTQRVLQMEQTLEGQGDELVRLRGRVADYKAQMARLEDCLQARGSSGGGARDGSRGGTSAERASVSSSWGGTSPPADLEAQVTELANERLQLEGCNLQLTAENEQLRRDVSGMREKLQEALMAAAVVSAADDRDASTAAEIARLQRELDAATAAAEELRAAVETATQGARAEAAAAQQRAEHSAALLLDFTAQAEAARAAEAEARAALGSVRAEALQLRIELEAARVEAVEVREQAEEAQREAKEARVRAEEALSELEAVREAASLEAEAARAEGEERARKAERERAEALEERAAAQMGRAQELGAEAAQLRARVAELQEQLQADRKASKDALEQLTAMHANEDALLQRILAGEAERQQLLRQIDQGNGSMADMRRRVDEAAQQAAEVAELKARVEQLAAEADRQGEAAAAAASRVAPLESELLELRAALRATAELASKEARVGERREQQLASLRQQALEAEEQQRQAEAELRILKAQVSVNERLRAQMDDLQMRLALAEAEAAEAAANAAVATKKPPRVDASTQVGGGGGTAEAVATDSVVCATVAGANSAAGTTTAAAAADIASGSTAATAAGAEVVYGSSHGLVPVLLPSSLPPLIECQSSPLRGTAHHVLALSPVGSRSPAHAHAQHAIAAAVAARQSLMAGWFGSGVGGQPFITEHMVAENLLASYNAIPEDEAVEDGDGGATAARRYGRGPASPRRRTRPLQVLLGLAIKGTLVASGMALGLALTGGSGRANTPEGGAQQQQQLQPMVVVEGIPLPAQCA